MNSRRKLSRRSFLATVTGGLAGAGTLALAQEEGAPPRPHPPHSSRAGAQWVDTDKGQYGDNVNIGGARGAGRSRVQQCSDTDSGPRSDPLGESRTHHSWSDNDTGPQSDPARPCPRPWYKH